MRFSEAWLREWVDPGQPRDELLEQLTMAGLEVDGVEPVAGEFSGVVVARIEACEPHPDADKLQVCMVNDGQEEHQVVCGAPNARVGLVTAFARVGAVLPEGFKIKKAKLRGVESFGMLCSAKELGIGEDHDGIMGLPNDFSLGLAVRDALQLDDVIVDIDLTPNRGDCLSLKGIAREVGVLNNAAVSFPEITPISAAHEDTFPVTLSAPQGCPRYLGRVIKGIDLSRPTPDWMQERLRRCGLRSIDPVVDVTNYVLIEQGQPMHAFDLSRLREGIDVRMAQDGDRLTLLDGQDVALDDKTLLITDASGPVAIAGVMGGERSGVQPDTQDVFLECAFFAPLSIAGTARRYGLHTDASHRYERGVDYGLQSAAIERATGLLLDIVGGSAGPVIATESPEHIPKAAIVTLRQQRLHALLGAEIEAAKIDECLQRLGLEVVDSDTTEGAARWTVRAPSHRFDIAIEADLVEEVCRVYGYNNIASRSPLAHLALRRVELEAHSDAALKRHLAAQGMQEVITYTFIDPTLADMFAPGADPLALANPMSQEQSVMRASLIPGLVDTLASNRARQQNRVRIFELGQIFVQGTDGLEQPDVVGGLIWGQRHPEAWHTKNEAADFYDLKGIVDNLMAWAGQHEVEFSRRDDRVLHPGQAATLYSGGVEIGRCGRLHPELEAKLDIEGVFVFELSTSHVLKNPRRQHGGVSRYPSVRRDLSLLLDRTVSAVTLEKCVREAVDERLIEFTLFDVYEGEGIDSNEKSIAIGLTFQSQTATLKEDEINQLADAALDALKAHCGARLR